MGALGLRTARRAKVPGNLPHVSSKVGVNVIHTECLTCSSLNYYGEPSGTKIVHALQRDYLDCVTETRIWQTCIQIALRELAFGKRVSKSRYKNLCLENVSSDRVTGARVCMVAQECTPTSRPQFSHIASAVLPRSSRSGSAVLPQSSCSGSAVFRDVYPIPVPIQSSHSGHVIIFLPLAFHMVPFTY